MGFNQTYLAIRKTWRANFQSQVPKKERLYFSNRTKNLQAAFQQEQYQPAISTTKELYGYFLRIANSENSSLKTPAFKIAGHLWSLEGILERKL